MQSIKTGRKGRSTLRPSLHSGSPKDALQTPVIRFCDLHAAHRATGKANPPSIERAFYRLVPLESVACPPTFQVCNHHHWVTQTLSLSPDSSSFTRFHSLSPDSFFYSLSCL